MTVSAVVPTYNGAHKILNILRALEGQDWAPDEVIVVVDGSTDNTIDLINRTEFSFKKLKVVEQLNKGRAVVRNRGFKEASSDLLVFFDDDMRPLPDCIRRHVIHHSKVPNSIAVGNVMEDYEVMKTDFQRYKAWLSRKWMSQFTSEDTTLINSKRPFITAANFSITKLLFAKLDGFDELLTDIEDFDLAMRASENNIPIYFLSNALAWHDEPVSCKTYIKRLREYKRAHNKLKAIKPSLYIKYSEKDEMNRAYKDKLFKLFAHEFWINIIDEGTLIAKLPQSMRYRLYDVVTTAAGVKFIN
ncbi:glycosyltransferase family 2 protein [Hymenobacter taeanensis]|uniref:Glycosyltransferase family 2 protein n=1 Tax=Hymenobacter taeanensis TaxID=2735321 RepID=A0A6M6BH81_9BACT|nr:MULTISPECIES: glycosyltransferase family 2 protein [Hymenobacter]QJX47557.1 glycosyltransferase family 2 protein [Hymenobacter taeanensis]UOQ82959.1 glycosyltransferase [Hymenobacter sp. 5414T-23]